MSIINILEKGYSYDIYDLGVSSPIVFFITIDRTSFIFCKNTHKGTP